MAQITWDQYDGFIHSNQVSKKFRETLRPRAKFRQFATLPPELENATQGKGERFYWNVAKKPAMQNFRLAETLRIESSTLDTLQNSLVVQEMGRAIEHTQKAQLLSMQNWEGIIKSALSYMAAHQFDVEVFLAMKSTPLHAAPTGGNSTTSVTVSTNGTTSITNNIELTTGHVKAIGDYMKNANIPQNMDRDAYICITDVNTLRPFKNELETINKYTPEGYAKIQYGEVGRYDDVIFIEQNMISKGGAVDSTTYDPYTDVADPWNNGKSSWAVFFGDDAVTEAAVVPEEIRAKLPEDYGRDKGAAWYALTGYGLTHPDADNARVVFWNSAA